MDTDEERRSFLKQFVRISAAAGAVAILQPIPIAIAQGMLSAYGAQALGFQNRREAEERKSKMILGGAAAAAAAAGGVILKRRARRKSKERNLDTAPTAGSADDKGPDGERPETPSDPKA